MEKNDMTAYAHPEALVETDWLAEHASDPTVRVFEVDVDTSAYEQGHVEGAIGLNWKTDLQQHPVRDLLSRTQLEALLSKNGVTPSTTIAVYGDNNNWFAAWLFWLLKYYGHADVRLVNGGSPKWPPLQRRERSGPIASHSPPLRGTPAPPPARA